MSDKTPGPFYSITITCPINERSAPYPLSLEVRGTYSVGFAADAPKPVAPTSIFVKCVVVYPNSDSYTNGPIEKSSPWSYQFTDLPATPDGMYAEVTAYLLDVNGDALCAPYGPVDCSIADPGTGCD